MAKSRGRDWGLPNADDSQSPVTRPILVECYRDRLVIVPDDRAQQPQVTRFDAESRDSIDEFVSEVWKHMNSWGIAGRGLYWRPTLVMSVKPGGEARYAELEALLADSGLDVRQRRPPATPAAASKKSPSRR